MNADLRRLLCLARSLHSLEPLRNQRKNKLLDADGQDYRINRMNLKI